MRSVGGLIGLSHAAGLDRIQCARDGHIEAYHPSAMTERGVKRETVADPTRLRRIREDAARPMAVNLAETIALSHALSRIAGAARRR